MEGERDVKAFDLVVKLPADYWASFSNMSKPWSSLTSNSLLISCSNNPSSERYFFTANDEELTALHRLTLSTADQPHTVTQILNQLFCFYDGNSTVFVCNLLSHEIIPLQTPSCLRSCHKYSSKKYCPEYFLGFEPYSKCYKVLNVCHIYVGNFMSCKSMDTNHTEVNCEVFGLGTDNSWRKIDAPHFRIRPYSQSVCVNGTLHWMRTDNGKAAALGAFDLKDEKFRAMSLPEGVSGHHDLIQVGENLAVLDCDDFRMKSKIRLWTLKDYNNEAWMKEDFDFPFSTMMLRRPIPINNSNRGEIMLIEYNSSLLSRVFVYDFKTQQRRMIEITETTDGNNFKFMDVGKRAGILVTYLSGKELPAFQGN
ncbi:putative F-box protein At4g21240 [Durio zibethinus]|uniref:F-box protein At4g21240 n=1 Tax=Durio zibethinus TaxID=66656 RepID=A0A6P5ZNT2_DURZI|nr:putative F-box protein At4g21240 [Durio zibethinus]